MAPLRRFLAFLALLLALSGGPFSRAQDAGSPDRKAGEPSDQPTPVVQRWRIGDLHAPLAVHRASDRLLTVERGGVLLWDTRSGLAIRSFPSEVREAQSVSALAFSPDGSRILLGDETGLRLLDAASGAAIVAFDHQGYALHDAALNPDGRWLAAACADAAVRVWDARSGRLERTLREHRYTVAHVRFSPDSRSPSPQSEPKYTRDRGESPRCFLCRSRRRRVWSMLWPIAHWPTTLSPSRRRPRRLEAQR